MNTLESNSPWFSTDFRTSITLALILHVFIVMIIFIVGRIVLDQTQNSEAIEVIKSSVRVDVVGMPKMTLQELKAQQIPLDASKEIPKSAEAKKEEVGEDLLKKDDVLMPGTAKASKKSLTSLLADYSSKKVNTNSLSQKGKSHGKTTGLEGLIIEGNRLSKGTALTGEISDMADSAFVGYVQTLPDKVREHWRLPGFLREKNLKCRLHVWIGPRGEIIKTNIRESSGNDDFDARAEAAVRSAAPFLPPPVDAAPKLATRGIVLGFPL